jgi:cytidyltransferase-like protein
VKGKQKATQNTKQTLQSFKERREDIENIFRISRLLFEAKNIFIQKYNNAVYRTRHFIENESGDLVASNPEGYVAVDHKGNGIKFVDRLEFSKANFAIDKSDKFSPELNEDEDEDDDPVIDDEYPKTVAVVPGAFKPPHLGHLDMVRKYANMADEVIVIISKPTKQGRYLPNGREITSADSLNIWNILASDLPNVDIVTSKTHASPINAAYEYVGEEGPVNIGDTVILGASTKDDDWKRWLGAEKYVKNGVKLLDPEKTAVNPTVRDSGEPYSATDFRNALGDPNNNREEIADFVGAQNVNAVLDILGLDTIGEMSGAGAVGGYAAPLGYGSVRPKSKKRKKNEYIDLSLIDEVMKLIKERGIVK